MFFTITQKQLIEIFYGHTGTSKEGIIKVYVCKLRKAVYTEGAGLVCKCMGQCTLQGSVQGGG